MDRFSKVDVLGLIELAEIGIAELDSVKRNDKLAFATWVLITSKGAKEARKRERKREEEARKRAKEARKQARTGNSR